MFWVYYYSLSQCVLLQNRQLLDNEMKNTFKDDVNCCIKECIHENGLQLSDLQIKRLTNKINEKEIEKWEENENFARTSRLHFTNRHKEQISKFIREKFRKSM